jgi:hypothetical protein
MKHHLTIIVGKTQLNFEGMTTILAKIEAILNWRPLVVESDDPEDPIAITPGYFLIGRPLVAVLQTYYTTTNIIATNHCADGK